MACLFGFPLESLYESLLTCHSSAASAGLASWACGFRIAEAEELKSQMDAHMPLGEKIARMGDDFDLDGILKLADELENTSPADSSSPLMINFYCHPPKRSLIKY